MATLYRKYRPQNFNEVVNQNHVKLTLEHEIESGKIAHAYMFCGPRAVGKTTLARVLAKAVNCEQRKEGEHEPCNICQSCVEITGGRSLDIIEIDAASHTGVDNVRENIIASARVVPVKSKFKVFIIDEVHMLSASAFNALLKIIEEPPAYVIFILCTTEIHKVPNTIISRCQRFDFKRISISDVVKKLEYITRSEDIKIEKNILESIARQSGGHMRDAESLLGQVVSIAGKEVTQEEADLVLPRSNLEEVANFIAYLSKKDAGGAIRLLNNLLDDGIEIKIFVNDIIDVLRKMIITKINPSLLDKLGLDLGESLEIKVDEISRNLSVGNLIHYIELFSEALNELKQASIQQLPVEIAIIKTTLSSPYDFSPSQPEQARINKAESAKPKIEASPKEKNSNIKSNITLKEISDRWNEVLAVIKKYNHSLSFVLRVCQPRELNGRELCLAFKYKFHKDRLNEPNIRAIVEKVITEVYKVSLTVSAVIDETIEFKENEIGQPDDVVLTDDGKAEERPAEDKNNNLMDSLLKTLGGKIVN